MAAVKICLGVKVSGTAFGNTSYSRNAENFKEVAENMLNLIKIKF